jgi:hypothetical protein
MQQEPGTLVVHLGSLDDLDGCFRQLDGEKFWRLETVPAQPWDGDVLLSATGPREKGDLYVFAGVLHEAELVEYGLHFGWVERFWHPVVAVYGKAGIRREDLIGDLQGWGPMGHHYLPMGVATKVAKEAEQSLRRGRL